MKLRISILLVSILLVTGGCITRFIPDLKEEQNLLVVEGMITDQPETYAVKLSISQQLGKSNSIKPLTGASVIVSDDAGHLYPFSEASPGIYNSNQWVFTGEIGRKYTLTVRANSGTDGTFTYESYPMELIPVPPIDSLYYEKVVLTNSNEWGRKEEGCQIYLDTYDQGQDCKYYRWSFTETWEFKLAFDVPNKTCWRSENSYDIKLKSTSVLAENKIRKYPLNFINNTSDRLTSEYSMLVTQYSMSQDEFDYWGKVQNVTENVGSLYDIVPSTVLGNMHCVEDPGRTVLGYFSVSSKSTKRIFVKDSFAGQANYYGSCIGDTIPGGTIIQGLGAYVWILYSNFMPPYTVITYNKSCADCTTRGTNIKPDFWDNKKSVTK
jgi:hypothetical protein